MTDVLRGEREEVPLSPGTVLALHIWIGLKTLHLPPLMEDLGRYIPQRSEVN